MRLLEEILKEVSQIAPDDVVRPDTEPKRDEHAVGPMTMDMLQLYTLWRRTQADAMRSAADLIQRGMSPGKESKTAALKDKSDLLEALFWHEIREHYDLWSHSTVCVRSDGQVAYSDSDTPDLPPFLKKLFGRE